MRKFVMLMALLVVVVIAGGFYLGWWKLSTSAQDGQGRSKVSLTVDENEMKKDLQVVKDKAGELKEKAQTRPEAKSVAGTISQIDADSQALTVTTDQREDVKIQLTDNTKILLGAKVGTLADLKSGDTVTVSYEAKKGERDENRATQVTVTPKGPAPGE